MALRALTLQLASVFALTAPSFGQEVYQPEEELEAPQWLAEVALSAISKTGNTESNDFGVAAKVEREGLVTRNFAEFFYDYGDTEGEETKNRLFAGYQHDRILTERWFAFGSASYEVDEFSGYEYQGTLNAGIGLELIESGPTYWAVRAGPGVRFEEVTDTGESSTRFAMLVGSKYSHEFSENVSFSLLNDVTSTEETTEFFNRAALSAAINGYLSARFSYELTYETEPPMGTEETDTTLRAALVFKRGE